MALDYLGSALAAVFAEDSLDFVVVHHVHAIHIILVEVESVVSVY
jgi:hypothetical protein